MPAKYASTDSQPLSRHVIHTREYLRVDLGQAYELLPIVRRLTRRAAEDLAPVQQRLSHMVPADPRNGEIKRVYQGVVTTWAGKIERLGLKVHGLWQVGFDSGCGWYGWQYPERAIRYFMEYDALFSDRSLLSEFTDDAGYMRKS